MTDVIAELSDVSHDERVARAIELGRQSKTDEKARAAIAALERGDAFARALAVWSTSGSGNGALLLRMAHDVSRQVRRLAFDHVPIVCNDAEALEALQIAFAMRREKRLAAILRARERTGVVDRFLDWVSTRPGVHDFADIVPLGSPEGIRRHVARALERPSALFWDRLARYGADVLGDELIARMQAVTGEADPVTRQLVNEHHREIAERAPTRGLALAELLVARQIFPRDDVWRALVANVPEGVVACFERMKHPLPDKLFARSWPELPVALLQRVIRSNPDALRRFEETACDLDGKKRTALADVWAEPNVAERFPTAGTALLAHTSTKEIAEQAYVAWQRGVMDKDGVVAQALVYRLPEALREREARRHLNDVVALHTRPAERFAYAIYLPWNEAKEAIETYLRHPEGSMRALALRTILGVVRMRQEDEALADEALEMVLARKNEQDPVRNSMIHSLVEWPRGVWKPKHTKAIQQILRDALDASDLSHGTARFGEELLLRTFRLDPAWGATVLGTWLKERGQLVSGRLGEHLTDDEVTIAAPVLLELASDWLARERSSMLLILAQSLGEKIKRVPGLEDVLARARDRERWGWIASGYAQLFREHLPERYAKDLPVITRRWLDQGWYRELATLALSYEKGEPLEPDLYDALEHIVLRSGDIGFVVAAVEAMRARAAKRLGERLPHLLQQDASLVALPAVHRFLHRRKQELLTPYLEGKPVTGRFASGHTGWILVFTDAFWRWTAHQSDLYAKQLVRAVSDTGRDTPSILQMLTVLPAVSWGPMEGLTTFASDARPVVQDKTIRVIGRCDQGQGIPTLLQCLADARARIAIYGLRRAIKDIPPARALEVLLGVPLNKVTVAKEAIRLIGELRSDAAYERLVALDRESLHRDVRIALLRAFWDHLEREATWEVYERAVTSEDWVMASRLGDVPADRLTKASDARLSALLAKVLSRPEPEARLDLLRRGPWLAIRDPARAFLSACRDRIASPYDDEVSAAMMSVVMRGAEDDVPALQKTLEKVRSDRRAFSVAIATMLQRTDRSRKVWVLGFEAAENAAAGDDALASLRVRIAGAWRSPESFATLVNEIATKAGKLAPDVDAACRLAIDAIPISGDVEVLPKLEAALFASQSEDVRRLSVHALVRDAGPGRGFSDARLARLAAYQRDPSPVVAGPAQLVFPPRELAPK